MFCYTVESHTILQSQNGCAFHPGILFDVYVSQNKRPISTDSVSLQGANDGERRLRQTSFPKMKLPFECRHSLPIYINFTFAANTLFSACCCCVSEWRFLLFVTLDESEICLCYLAGAEFPRGPRMYSDLSTLHCVTFCILAIVFVCWLLSCFFPVTRNNLFSSTSHSYTIN